jgi:Skp family chaperone for outer membrane proteins
MRKIAFHAAVAVAAMAAPAVAHAEKTPAAVVIVIDTARVYSQCTACVAAQAQLQTMITSARTRAQQLGEPLQTEAQSIEQAAAAAQSQSGAARTAAETALNTRAQAYQQRQTAAQQEISRLEQNIQSSQSNVLQQINAQLDPIYSRVMTAHGANLAVDTGASLAHANSLDVTSEVLAALNAALPTLSVTPLPASTQPAPGQSR